MFIFPEHKRALFQSFIFDVFIRCQSSMCCGLLGVLGFICVECQRFTIFVQELIIVRRLQAGLVFNLFLLGLRINVARVQRRQHCDQDADRRKK